MFSHILFLESLIDGIVLGGIYAIIALGLSLIYSVAGVLNISHGDLVMLSGMLAFLTVSTAGVQTYGYLAAYGVVIPLFFLIGLVFYLGLIRPVMKRSRQELLLTYILITLGVSFILQDTAATLFGTLPRSLYLGFEPIKVADISVPFFRFITFLIVSAATLLTWFFLKRTMVGCAMRAVAYNIEATSFLGVPISRIAAITFGIGTFYAALGGLVYLGNGFPLTPFIGISLTVKALTVLVVGGAGKLVGALVGGMVLGLAETLTGAFISYYWSPAIAILLLLIILMVKPTGLIGD
ncbi:MAG: branched-chain amino acid ABC transporter permease [Candidatus Caldarchaeum sp.]|nr:branched-chain amino acid ABC transporter permease [Candidatus Caldarchaeum sp.]